MSRGESQSAEDGGAVVEGLESAGVRASLLEYLHACPICKHGDLRHYCRVPSLFQPGEHIHYERCRRCGIVLRNPRLPAGYRVSRYEEIILPDAAKRLKPQNQVHYAFMVRRLRSLVPGGRLLDFGCGAGGFLLEAQKAGYDVMGLELNRDLAQHVRDAYGIPTYSGQVTEPEFAAERFNLVISSQVFEHLLDPRATLAELRRHLEPPGLVLIEVPNLLALRERLHRGRTMNDSHIFYFSAQSLGWLFRDLGFRVLQVRQGLRPYRLASGKLAGLPDGLQELGEKIFATFGVRTGLSVIAKLES